MTTTPRDDIGLTKAQGYADSLRQQARWIEEALDDATPKHQRIDIGDIDTDELKEAATQLDAYRSEISDWANEVARYKTYAEKFEQENAALSARVKELEAQKYDAAAQAIDAIERADAAESRALRAEQQRDEAYARAATIAHDIKNRCIVESTNPDRPRVQQMASSAQAFTASEIAAAIRRLAAGDEEGK